MVLASASGGRNNVQIFKATNKKMEPDIKMITTFFLLQLPCTIQIQHAFIHLRGLRFNVSKKE